MPTSRTGRPYAVLAAAALAAGVMTAVAPTATAAPVFTDAQTDMTTDYDAHDDGPGACSASSVPTPSAPQPVLENGAPVTVSQGLSATDTDGVADTQTANITTTGTGSVSSAGGTVKALDFTSTSQVSQTQTQPTSPGCLLHAYASAQLNFEFTVAQAGFLTVKVKNRVGFAGSRQDAELQLYRDDPIVNDPSAEDYSEGLNIDRTTRVYLPAGTYYGDLQGEGGVQSVVATGGTSSSSIHATFAVAGSQTVAAAGKGAKYVSMPSARSCAAGTVAPTLTTAKKAAKKVKSVKVFVNDQLAKKFKKPAKGAALTVPVAADQMAEVSAEVTLFPKKKGKKSKVYSVSSSYEACGI
jgi:hypothetical protein